MSKVIRSAALSLLLSLLLGASALAQDKLDEAAAKNLKTQADEMSRAFIAGDNGRLADFVHPRVIELAGGRAKLLELLDNGSRDFREKGVEPLSQAVSGPMQVLKVGRRTYVVVATTLRLKTPGGIYVTESYTIGVTDDGGVNWKFVAASNNTPEQLGILLPEISGKLNIPARKPIALEPLPEPSPTPAATATPTPAPSPTPTPAPTPKPTP